MTSSHCVSAAGRRARFAAAFALALSACSSSEEKSLVAPALAARAPGAASLDAPDVARIGRGGGVLRSSDGVVTLTVPPRVVATDTTFTIQRVAGEALSIGPTYDIQPSGHLPAVVVLSFAIDPSIAASVAITDLRLARWDDGVRVVTQRPLLDAASGSIGAVVDHLSRWGVTRAVPSRCCHPCIRAACLAWTGSPFADGCGCQFLDPAVMDRDAVDGLAASIDACIAQGMGDPAPCEAEPAESPQIGSCVVDCHELDGDAACLCHTVCERHAYAMRCDGDVCACFRDGSSTATFADRGDVCAHDPTASFLSRCRYPGFRDDGDCRIACEADASTCGCATRCGGQAYALRCERGECRCLLNDTPIKTWDDGPFVCDGRWGARLLRDYRMSCDFPGR